ncbi:MAG: site-specific DNA-methyltransferase [Thermomonas sp.]|uniref:site-specific DNA-methyltransferase n=1 Tax=Thermomonas sp. TaxID=1971895 RepID=UPI001ECDFDCB|nr:site-specific DNA-methyltransferase [Thermomonas sp.]MBV2210372.1 site-specific DNA-methyltransferase [Thermomonas sp.]
MPSLNWIGKAAVVNHHQDVPFRLLEPVQSLSCGDADTGNLIVQGDNLLALKALLPRYAGQVKCIYIDPPYNTGNEGWVYNDNVNSPEIRRWLGEVVGKEGETLDRHDRWLCMMYPRLMLLKQFLREDGVIFVSIDDNEVASLRLVMDEIFGARNFVSTIIWEKRYSPQNAVKWFSESHDFLVVYAKNKDSWKPHLLERSDEMNARYRNLDNDPRGDWKPADATAQAGHGTESQFYTFVAPNGKRHELPSGRCWVYTEPVFRKMVEDNRVWFGARGDNVPALKRFLTEVKQGVACQTIWKYDDVGHSQEGKKEVNSLFPDAAVFDTPKTTRLLQRILQIATDKDSLILDSFAGSGTTAHAVLKQNAEDGGNRRFILVEINEGIARDVTAERVKRVAQGYTNGKGQQVEGLGGGFQFCKLGKPLFDARGHISNEVRFAELARFVWFVETGMGLPGKRASRSAADTASPLLGVHQGRAVYLLYNGILKDRSIDGGNVLTSTLLQHLPAHNGPKVVYAARCAIGADRLRKLGITFKQLPYHLRVAP